jgi:hypothetical protein
MLRATLGSEQPIVLALDRGGFDFGVLAQLDRAGLYYVLYVPATVKMPALEEIAPAGDGAGSVMWTVRMTSRLDRERSSRCSARQAPLRDLRAMARRSARSCDECVRATGLIRA